MFIGGLSWQTAPGELSELFDMLLNTFSFFLSSLHLIVWYPYTEGLREYFSKFGDITEVMVMKDPTTRRSR